MAQLHREQLSPKTPDIVRYQAPVVGAIGLRAFLCSQGGDVMSRYRTVRQRRKAREDLIGYIVLVPTGLIILGLAFFGFIQIFAV